MPVELAPARWKLPALSAAECGPYGIRTRPDDASKQELWHRYRAGRAGRAPVTLGTNNRVFLLDRRFDAEGLTYEQVARDPRAMLIAQLRWQYILRSRHHHFCDHPTALPERWEVSVSTQNVYEAAFFGAPVRYHTNSVPEAVAVLGDDHKHAVFEVDLDRPLARGFFRQNLDLCEQMAALAVQHTFFGRPIAVTPYADLGTDGPLTVGLNLRGPQLLVDLRRDPEYVRRLFAFIVEAALRRRRAFLAHWNLPAPEQVWLADDSIALLGPAQYRQHVLPHHRRWFDALDPERRRPRGMHLCGDATRHFGTLRDACGVTIFDTGFPVDFGRLRAELGPEVELLGGPEVPLLVEGTPEQVHVRTRAILESGVLTGGPFTLREGNNLPPGVPWANLAAMYAAALEGT